MKDLTYKTLMNEKDFEYFFRFQKREDNFQDLWRMKSTARESLKEWLFAIHTTPQTSEVIANAASELIENCIKYSQEESFSFVLIHVVGRIVQIETMNRAQTEQKKMVEEFIGYVNSGLKNLTEFYIERITGSVVTGKSQLGFLKILMETNGKLELIKETDESIIHLKVTMTV